MDIAVFDSAEIRVEFQQFECPRYPQHWSGADGQFVPGLSALDLLVNCGPRSLDVLMGHTEGAASPPGGGAPM